MSNNAHDLSKRLLNALDNSYNVVDMHAVNEIISILEKINITKELLETTRLGKHVNELRRRTAEPSLARRAKVLVKRWRDLVIPAPAAVSAAAGPSRPATEPRRRLGGTPLTSPALPRNAVSPAAPSPRPPSRPAWGGYESDSNDVIILVDDDPPPAPLVAPPAAAPAPLVAPLVAPPAAPHTPQKRPPSPTPLSEEKKSKRDKKPKKKRGHSRAGSGSEAAEWTARNGSSPPPAAPAPAPAAPTPAPAAPAPARRNGCRTLDAYSALVQRMPPAGAKKVKTTKELLEEIQSRGARPPSPAPLPPSPGSPGSPDVMLIEPDVCFVKLDSPLRNGSSSPAPAAPAPAAAPARAPSPRAPLEDPREYHDCTCGAEPAPACPAARAPRVSPALLRALHHALLPGVNGTRAPPHPHQYAVHPPARPDAPGLFASVVPLYKYSDYADDYCVKNMSRVPVCPGQPWTEFAPAPPSPPPRPAPPSPRPYPVDDPPAEPSGDDPPSDRGDDDPPPDCGYDDPPSDRGDDDPPPERVVDDPPAEPSDDDPPPEHSDDDDKVSRDSDGPSAVCVKASAAGAAPREPPPPAPCDGRALVAQCAAALAACPYRYAQARAAPVLSAGAGPAAAAAVLALAGAGPAAAAAAVEAALAGPGAERDALGRPPRPALFAEWHECARLGDLIALPYVVID